MFTHYEKSVGEGLITVENLIKEDDSTIVLRKPSEHNEIRLIALGLDNILNDRFLKYCRGDKELFRAYLFHAIKRLDFPQNQITSYIN